MDSNSEVSEKYESPRKNLYEVFSHANLSTRQRRMVIDALDDIDGFDIAFVISYILSYKLQGHLNIVSHTNEVSGITFGKGYIAHIDFPDKKTYLGILLQEEGLVDKKDLEEALAQKAVSVGQYLVKKKSLTEQQISEVVSRQMRLRLSKLICENTFKINFHEASEVDMFINIPLSDYFSISHDWIAGRYDASWLNLHFMPWENNQIVFTENEFIAQIFQMPMLVQFPELIVELKNGSSLSALKTKYKDKQPLLLKIIYFLNMARLLHFKGNEDHKGGRLQAIYKELRGKKDFELAKAMSQLTKVNERNLDQIYLAFLQFVEENSSEEEVEYKNELIKLGIKILTQKQSIAAHQSSTGTSSDPSPAAFSGLAKPSPVGKPAIKPVQNKDTVNQILPTLLNNLLNQNLIEAVPKIKMISGQKEIVPSVKLYQLWFKVIQSIQTKNNNANTLENDLVQLLPEDKETAEYYYIRSLIAHLKGDKVNQVKMYEAAVKKKPLFAKHPIKSGGFFAKILSKLRGK